MGLERDLRFAVAGQAEITDAAKYEETKGTKKLREYMSENTPQFLNAAIRMV